MAGTIIQVPNPTSPRAQLWKLAQLLGVLGTLGLVVGLVVRPAVSLRLLWDVSIPVLPAVFLISPVVWRNVCPLATLNKFVGDRYGQRQLPARWVSGTSLVGIALLFLLVPARRFLFNTNGVALAVTILVVAVLAVALGFVFAGKAGFCNAVCPVLSVERLYGQRPLAPVTNARCAPCTLCTGRGCIDLTPEKSVAQTVGPKRRTRRWITTPFGAFAASFPGFIYAYFTAADGPLGSALSVYGHFLTWSAVSFLVVGAISMTRPSRNEQTVLMLGALSIGLYYWFAAPTFMAGIGLPEATAIPFRAMTLSLVGVWLFRGFRTIRVRSTERPLPATSG